jgi:hypothetical protein
LKNLICLSFYLILFAPVSAQYAIDTYYQNKELVYEDHIYQVGIKTVKLHPANNPLGPPLIALNSDQRLRLSFDDLYEDFVNYSYTIYHCNADWQPSDLMVTDYLSNFSQDYIQQYEYSLNALIPYTNYHLSIPNEQLNLTKSGNYLLVVYRNDDESDLVLSRRFMVYEDLVNVGATIRRATNVEKMNSHQEVDFILSHPKYNIQNPFRDLQVHLLQNFRYDNAITNLKPAFLQNNQLIYQYDNQNTFAGVNEFRFFDIKNLQSLTQNVRNIKRDSFFTVYLRNDLPRPLSEYAVWLDINGRFQIRRLDAGNSETEADYAVVDFILKKDRPYTEGDVYIFGQLSDWKLRPEYKMQYDDTRKAYRAQALLKQGYYNYYYAIFNAETGSAAPQEIEGSHWETENIYSILVYNREVGSRYDRLVGYGSFSSEELY